VHNVEIKLLTNSRHLFFKILGRGGRDGGGGRAGGGGRGGAGGREGRNRHMGEIGSVMALANSITDREILAVIAPSAADRAGRKELVGTRYQMPGLEAWRAQTPVGRQLNEPTHIVKSNFYSVETQYITPEVAYLLYVV